MNDHPPDAEMATAESATGPVDTVSVGRYDAENAADETTLRSKILHALLVVVKRHFGCVEWLPSVKAKDLPNDIVSGLIIGVVLLPQTLSYTSVLQFPQLVGLSSTIVAGIGYSVFGSVPFLSVGPAAETTAFLLAALSASTVGEKVVQAQMFAVISGLIAIGCSFVRGGSLLKVLLSRAVGEGYSTAAALLVIVLQLKAAFNVGGASTATIDKTVAVLIESLREKWSVHALYSFLLYLAYALYLGLIPYVKRLPRWLPHQLFVLIVSTLVTAYGKLDERIGLSIQKSIPSTLPTPSAPSLSLSTADIPSVFVLALICFLQNYTVTSSGATGIDPDRELWASGVVNLCCGVFGAYPVTAAFSRCGILRDRQVKTPLTHLVGACVMIAVLGGLNRINTFYYLPGNALAAILTVAMGRVINLRTPLTLWRVNRMDLVAWVVTFIMTLFLGITAGILSGIAVSLLFVLLRVARPVTVQLGLSSDDRSFVEVRTDLDALTFPRVLLWRFSAPIVFVNVSYFESNLLAAIEDEVRPIDVVVVNCSFVLQIDSSALTQLPLAIRNIERMNPSHLRRVLLAEFPETVARLLIDEGVCTLIDGSGDEHSLDSLITRIPLFLTVQSAIEAARKMVSENVLTRDKLLGAPRPEGAYVIDALEQAARRRANPSGPGGTRTTALPVDSEQVRGDYFGVAPDDHFLAKLAKTAPHNAATRHLIGCSAVIRHADRTPKMKLKLRVASSTNSREVENLGEEKFKAPSGSVKSAVLRSFLENYLAGDAEDAAVARRLLQFLDSPLPELTWQVKARETVTVIAKWGGRITESGVVQSRRHGHRLIPLFVASGDIDIADCARLRKEATFCCGSEERLVETAINVAQALLEDNGFTLEDLRIDDSILADPSDTPFLVSLRRRRAEVLSTVLHAQTKADAYFHRHIPALDKLLGVTPDAAAPFDVLRFCYALMENLAGGAAHVALARASGEAAAFPLAAGVDERELAERESVREFKLRWAVIAAAFGHASSSEGPFDVTVLQRIGDYSTFDFYHTLPSVQAIASDTEAGDNLRAWARETSQSITSLVNVAFHLLAVAMPLSLGGTPTERFISGSVICAPLLSRLRANVEAYIARDRDTNVTDFVTRYCKAHHCALEPSDANAVSSPTHSLDLHFADHALVAALQNCLFDCRSIQGFRCAAEYRYQQLGYMTHILFKVFRVRQRPFLDFENPLPHTSQALRDLVRNEWDSCHTYLVVPYLSTGMQLAEHQLHNTDSTNAHEQVLAHVRIHSGFTTAQFEMLLAEVTEAIDIARQLPDGKFMIA